MVHIRTYTNGYTGMLDIIGHIHQKQTVFVIKKGVQTILQDITINPDVEKEIATLKEEHSNI